MAVLQMAQIWVPVPLCPTLMLAHSCTPYPQLSPSLSDSLSARYPHMHWQFQLNCTQHELLGHRHLREESPTEAYGHSLQFFLLFKSSLLI